MQLTDLTHVLRHGTEGYPGDPGVKLTTRHVHDEAGYHVTEMHLGSHVGTHIDVPLHVFPGAEDVTQIDLAKLVGPARMIDLGTVQPGHEIGADEVGTLYPGERILIKTGWARRFGTDDYHRDFPQVSLGLAEAAIEAGIAALGLEQPSLHHSDGLSLHHKLLRAGVLIIEGLNLQNLQHDQFDLVCLPLAVQQLDGCPVRAIAVTQP